MIERNTVEERVKIVMENIVLQGYEINDTSTFYDMGLDSLDKIELCMDLEDEFRIEIPDDAMPYIDTYGEIVQYILTRLNKE